MHPEHRKHQQRAFPLHPGGWRVESERPISTLLGSCVAVCLHDPQIGLGGMNHFLLPQLTRRKFAAIDTVLSGDYAMEVLVNALLKRGASKSRLVAKAFGGGAVVQMSRFDIGDRNAEFACEWLAQEGIPLLASDLGGDCARQVILIPKSGEALCRRIVIRSQQRIDTLAQRERDYARSLQQSRRNGAKVELF